MNDLFLDALGISEEVEELQLKGSKKKKSRQLDEDFIVSALPKYVADLSPYSDL
jgi:histone-lysine N-methyltransferase SETD2